MNWGSLTRAERDAAYNNPLAVPEAASMIPAWIAESGAFRTERPAHLDIPYGARERNKWDLYPAADPKAPCIVFIHGGYWQRFGRESFTNLIAGPHAMGWSAALPGYTLCPDVTLTDIVAEFNRRNPVQLAVDDATLGALRLSAAFRSDNVEGFVRLMESDFGMRAEWRSEREIVLRRAK